MHVVFRLVGGMHPPIRPLNPPLVPSRATNISNLFSLVLDSALNLDLIYIRSENDSTLLTCQPTTGSHAHRFTKVNSRTSSRVLVLNVGLLLTLQKFRSALRRYVSRSSPGGFILEDPHIV